MQIQPSTAYADKNKSELSSAISFSWTESGKQVPYILNTADIKQIKCIWTNLHTAE